MELLIQNGILIGCRGVEPETALVLPEGIHTIGEKAFFECKGLVSVTFPQSLHTIGDYAFCWCEHLQSVHIPGNVRTIGKEAFSFCKELASVTLEEGVEFLGKEAFRHCATLLSITLPQSLRRIQAACFKECFQLSELVLPRELPELPPHLCDSCLNLERIELPVHLTEISDSTFHLCRSLTEVALPDSVRHIRYGAFHGCKSLRKIHLPEGLMSIGEYAFSCCESLEQLIIPASVITIGSSIFSGARLKRLELRCILRKLPPWMLRNCMYLEELILPDTLTKLGEEAVHDTPPTYLTLVQGDVRVRIPAKRNGSRYAGTLLLELLDLLCHHSPTKRVDRAERMEGTACYPMLMFYFSLLYPDPRCKAAVDAHFPKIAEELCSPANAEYLLSYLEQRRFTVKQAEQLLDLAAERGETRLVPYLLRYLHADGSVTGDWTL